MTLIFFLSHSIFGSIWRRRINTAALRRRSTSCSRQSHCVPSAANQRGEQGVWRQRAAPLTAGPWTESTAMATAVTPSRPFHIVVFGATGFTGQFVVEEVARCSAESPSGSALKWAVAGRSRRRLEEVLKRAADRLCRCLIYVMETRAFGVTAPGELRDRRAR